MGSSITCVCQERDMNIYNHNCQARLEQCDDVRSMKRSVTISDTRQDLSSVIMEIRIMCHGMASFHVSENMICNTFSCVQSFAPQEFVVHPLSNWSITFPTDSAKAGIHFGKSLSRRNQRQIEYHMEFSLLVVFCYMKMEQVDQAVLLHKFTEHCDD